MNTTELKKDVFGLVTSVGQRKNSESPWGIEPQTFGLRADALPPSHRDSTVSEILILTLNSKHYFLTYPFFHLFWNNKSFVVELLDKLVLRKFY